MNTRDFQVFEAELLATLKDRVREFMRKKHEAGEDGGWRPLGGVTTGQKIVSGAIKHVYLWTWVK